MMTYKTGSAAFASSATSMVAHLMTPTIPLANRHFAAYYQHDTQRVINANSGFIASGPRLRDDVDSRFLEIFNVGDGRRLSETELANLLAGRTSTGDFPHLGPARSFRRKQEKSNGNKKITFVDFCFSADKSVSIAWALAPSPSEGRLIANAHNDAVASTMRYIEQQIVSARRGKNGLSGAHAGRICWITFDHYTSRRVAEHSLTDMHRAGDLTHPIDNTGDPQLHSHVIALNSVLTSSGHLGSLDLSLLRGRVHEFGRVYQAALATNLMSLGIDVEMDRTTHAAKISAIPANVRKHFSKRTEAGTTAAIIFAEKNGIKWNALDTLGRIKMIKSNVQGNVRQKKTDDPIDYCSWHRQAAALGWRPRSVLNVSKNCNLLPDERRLELACDVATELLQKSFTHKAVLEFGEVRAAAAASLIEVGMKTTSDLDQVISRLCQAGVRVDGHQTSLLLLNDWDIMGRPTLKATTQLRVEQEEELIRLASEARDDMSAALDLFSLDVAISATGIVFTEDEHGRAQRAALEKLACGGRLCVAIGVAGAGKTTLVTPLVHAWKGDTWGTAISWRQSQALEGVGIPTEACLAISVFLNRVRTGEIELNRDSLVLIDELGTISTRMLLELLRLQAEKKFKCIGIGDPRQCQSIEAGPVIELLRRALGNSEIPEILSSVRQFSQAERATSLMFREGRADNALSIKREDGSAFAVAGSKHVVADAVAALWHSRRAAAASVPDWTISVSAPTNSDAMIVAAAIRRLRQKTGELGKDEWLVTATDNRGEQFDLPLAIGDRVRLFRRTNAIYEDRSRGLIGNNGSVLEVVKVGSRGITLRNTHGRVGLVAWKTLRSSDNNILLGYGDVLTIDASQGLTTTEHIEAMPNGSQFVNAYKAYVSSSRHRSKSYIVTSSDAERRQISSLRMLGDTRPIAEGEIWSNVARNFSRLPEYETATTLLERAANLRSLAVKETHLHFWKLENTQVAALLQRNRANLKMLDMAIAAGSILKQSSERLTSVCSRAIGAMRRSEASSTNLPAKVFQIDGSKPAYRP